MQKVWRGVCLVVTAGLAIWPAMADRAGPKLDAAKLEAYVRYLEGYTPQVKLAFDAPVPSAYNGYFRVVVHLSIQRDKGVQQIGDKVYYTPDGERFAAGQVFDMGQNPFADALSRLPVDGPSFGPADAKVTVVVFSDFECPYCREFAKTVRNNVPEKYSKDVRVVYANYPIESLHPWAFQAAEAGHCIASEKAAAFWPFHDWIFQHQGEITPQNVKEQVTAFAKAQGVAADQMSACMERPETAAAIRESIRTARELQVQQTPSLFVNGRMLGGAVPWETLNAVIQLELNRPKEVPGPGSVACCAVEAPTVVPKER